MSRKPRGGDGTDRPLPDREDRAFLVRHDQELDVGTRWRGSGILRARRRVTAVPIQTELPIDSEQLTQTRVTAEPGDSGQIETLPDGSISIPIYAEELVIVKRTVLRERVIIRKETVTETQRIEEQLHHEHLELDADEGTDIIDDRPPA